MLPARLRALAGRLARGPRTHVVVAAAAAASALALLDFEPPPTVRPAAAAEPVPVGDPQRQPLEAPDDPEAARVRVLLYAAPEDGGRSLDAEPDEPPGGDLLSAPVVTTVYGVTAHVEQAVHLGDDRTLYLRVAVTPERGKRRSDVRWAYDARAVLEERGLLGRRTRRRTVFAAAGRGRDWSEVPVRLAFEAGERAFVVLLEGRTAAP